MVLDLHIEGAGPITLLVRDESRSTHSTSGKQDSQNNKSPNTTNTSALFPR